MGKIVILLELASTLRTAGSLEKSLYFQHSKSEELTGNFGYHKGYIFPNWKWGD